MQKLIVSLALALGVLIPSAALAQTSSGLLTVYVQVLTQTGYSAFQTYSPSSVTVGITGNGASLNNFPGSQSGTTVSLNPGSYNVVVTNSIPGYVPSYSAGCNNTIAAGGNQTCVITMTPSYSYYGQNQYTYGLAYPYYGYGVPPLSCQALVPSVALGQQVTFRATGGAGGTYNWVAPYTQTLNYPSAGQTLTVVFQATGAQTVTVTNAAQTATCSVLVTSGFYPTGTTYPYQTYPYQTYTYPYQGQYTYSNPVQIQPYYQQYPQLPRTGFGPRDGALGAVFAAVLLIAAGIMTAPYGRKAFAVVSR